MSIDFSIFQPAQLLANITLAKTAQPAQIRLLTLADLPQILALQQEVAQNLGPAEQKYFLPKTALEFQQRLTGQSRMLGVVVAGKLVAQAMLSAPIAGAYHQHVINALQISPHCLMFDGSLVSPSMRGHNLMAQLLQQQQKMAAQLGVTQLAGTVDIANHHSWRLFTAHGFWLGAAGIDPDDGGHIFYVVQRPDFAPDNATPPLAKQPVSGAGALPALQALFAQGLVGTAWDSATQCALFHKLEPRLSTRSWPAARPANTLAKPPQSGPAPS